MNSVVMFFQTQGKVNHEKVFVVIVCRTSSAAVSPWVTHQSAENSSKFFTFFFSRKFMEIVFLIIENFVGTGNILLSILKVD